MKLFGNSKPKKKNETPKAGGPKSQHVALKVIFGVLLGVTALGIGAVAFLKLAPTPPPQWTPPPVIVTAPPTAMASADPSAPVETLDPDAPTPIGVNRTPSKYTFFVFGTDDGNGNTDVMMAATLDVATHTLNVVNIPRDTLVNVSWNVKKANSLYAAMKGPEGAIEKLADVLGYETDFYIAVDLKAFRELVDAIGGVDFDVPVNMNYEDPAQNLIIHINKGMQHLNGTDALKVVRFRKTYAAGDIKRISVQQDFLMSAAKQVLAKKSSIKISSIVNIFLKYVKTDLNARYLMWFANELFKLDAENISFATLPGDYGDSFRGESYVTIYVDQWLEMINAKLNPFDQPITAERLSVLTRNSSGALYVTSGTRAGDASWGSGSKPPSGGNSSSTSTPKPSAPPVSTPTPTDTTPATEAPDANPNDYPPIDAPNTPEIVTVTMPPAPNPNENEVDTNANIG